jgi:hypothetical protein
LAQPASASSRGCRSPRSALVRTRVSSNSTLMTAATRAHAQPPRAAAAECLPAARVERIGKRVRAALWRRRRTRVPAEAELRADRQTRPTIDGLVSLEIGELLGSRGRPPGDLPSLSRGCWTAQRRVAPVRWSAASRCPQAGEGVRFWVEAVVLSEAARVDRPARNPSEADRVMTTTDSPWKPSGSFRTGLTRDRRLFASLNWRPRGGSRGAVPLAPGQGRCCPRRCSRPRR